MSDDPLWRWSDLTLVVMLALMVGFGLAMVSGWDGLACLCGCMALVVVYLARPG